MDRSTEVPFLTHNSVVTVTHKNYKI